MEDLKWKKPAPALHGAPASGIDQVRGQIGTSHTPSPITVQLVGDDTAHVGDIVARGRSPVFALCRALLAAGTDPQSRLECYRETTLALVVKSVGRGAQLTVKERDRGGLEIARWEPFPSSPGRACIRPIAEAVS
jgi:hypothetical protein